MSSLDNFKDVIEATISDKKFHNLISGDVLAAIESVAEKKKVLQSALQCIFGQPMGVRTNPVTQKYKHITNNKNWRPFCSGLLRHVEKEFPDKYEELKAHSGLYQNYQAFWPDCQDALAEDVKKAQDAAAEQKKKAA